MIIHAARYKGLRELPRARRNKQLLRMDSYPGRSYASCGAKFAREPTCDSACPPPKGTAEVLPRRWVTFRAEIAAMSEIFRMSCPTNSCRTVVAARVGGDIPSEPRKRSGDWCLHHVRCLDMVVARSKAG